MVGRNNEGNTGEGEGGTTVERLGLARADVIHGGWDQGIYKGEVDMSAKLQDHWWNRHNQEVSRLASASDFVAT